MRSFFLEPGKCISVRLSPCLGWASLIKVCTVTPKLQPFWIHTYLQVSFMAHFLVRSAAFWRLMLWSPFTSAKNLNIICNSNSACIVTVCLINFLLENIDSCGGQMACTQRPNGVLKVVHLSYVDSSSNWTFQYPFCASSLLNIVAPESFGVISSSVDTGLNDLNV